MHHFAIRHKHKKKYTHVVWVCVCVAICDENGLLTGRTTSSGRRTRNIYTASARSQWSDTLFDGLCAPSYTFNGCRVVGDVKRRPERTSAKMLLHAQISIAPAVVCRWRPDWYRSGTSWLNERRQRRFGDWVRRNDELWMGRVMAQEEGSLSLLGWFVWLIWCQWNNTWDWMWGDRTGTSIWPSVCTRTSERHRFSLNVILWHQWTTQRTRKQCLNYDSLWWTGLC